MLGAAETALIPGATARTYGKRRRASVVDAEGSMSVVIHPDIVAAGVESPGLDVEDTRSVMSDRRSKVGGRHGLVGAPMAVRLGAVWT
jgi:hypothetical protein